MSKKRYAGGGAGIKFEVKDVDMDMELVVSGTIKNIKARTKRIGGEIVSFDATGYYDGMRNVSGKKVFSKIIFDYIVEDAVKVIKEEIDYYTDKGRNEERVDELNDALKRGVECDVYFAEGRGRVIFAGFTRGKLKQGNHVEFDANMELHTDYFSSRFDSSIGAILSKTGEEWYQDVFEYTPNDEDDDYDSLFYHDDLKMLYGV